MTEMRETNGLRERFQELRSEAEQPGRVPDFGAMLARARSDAVARPTFGVIPGGRARTGSRRFVRAGAWASAALAATVAVLIFTDRRPSADADFEQLVAAYSADVSGGVWRSPTSRLLAVPGMELTRSMPSIGAPVLGLDPSTLPPREPAITEGRS